MRRCPDREKRKAKQITPYIST
uniref:Uncharacterized protein n=1 Tax=Arundo donax TaxID=35708 RepID=A0A0A9GW58_ARUDO